MPRSRGRGEGRLGSRHQETEDCLLLDGVERGAGELLPRPASGWVRGAPNIGVRRCPAWCQELT